MTNRSNRITNHIKISNWKFRVTGFLLLAATAWYLPWLLGNLNWQAPWLSIPFAAASLIAVIMTGITLVNHWSYTVPQEHRVPEGKEPEVVVIIPTYGEPPAMVYQTVQSVLEQNYPQERIHLIISDDSHRLSMRTTVHQLKTQFPNASIHYHDPPKRGNPARRGDAKAGNLNGVLDNLDTYAPNAQFVETRDADDQVGDPDFLRQTVGQLLAQPKVAFVQTIKEAVVSRGDPFGNLEPLFYRKAMFAKNASNAVFPCGSGLVWRRQALDDIGGFPAWNLVEDLQSGVEALRRGWRGVYLPIVGAFGQTAPEDIPNSIKQRGTWALDTMRLTFWGNKRGLNLRQHLHFAELGFFYLLSFAVLIFAVTPVITLTLRIYPLAATGTEYILHFWPYAAMVELLLVGLSDGLPYRDLWRARQTWLGMAPVYARATIIALLYGPNDKPSYRVTRKENVAGLYFIEIYFQLGLFLALIGAALYHVATHSPQTMDLGSLFWAGFFALSLSRIVRNAWHGARLGKSELPHLQSETSLGSLESMDPR